MTKQGYLIARNRQIGAFFTSASAYDRPKWVAVTEATKYMSAEMAQIALKKLLGYGAFEARVVPIREVISLELPDDAPADPAGDLPPVNPLSPEGQIPDELPPEDDATMSASSTEEVCPECDHEPCTCEHHSDDELGVGDEQNADQDVDDEVDAILGNGEFEGSDIAKRKALDDELSDQVQFRESATMPAKPSLDGTTDNKNTVDSAKKPELIKFKDEADAEPGKAEPINSDHEEKVTVPSTVLSDLQKVSSEMTAEANKYKERDDTRASFCMTVAAAMDTLKMHLSTGTVAGVKQAQISLGTMMSPITQHVPVSAKKFITMGGRKPSLKDMFTAKWDAKRG